MERDILLLGNPRLYEISEEVKREETVLAIVAGIVMLRKKEV